MPGPPRPAPEPQTVDASGPWTAAGASTTPPCHRDTAVPRARPMAARRTMGRYRPTGHRNWRRLAEGMLWRMEAIHLGVAEHREPSGRQTQDRPGLDPLGPGTEGEGGGRTAPGQAPGSAQARERRQPAEPGSSSQSGGQEPSCSRDACRNSCHTSCQGCCQDSCQGCCQGCCETQARGLGGSGGPEGPGPTVPSAFARIPPTRLPRPTSTSPKGKVTS